MKGKLLKVGRGAIAGILLLSNLTLASPVLADSNIAQTAGEQTSTSKANSGQSLGDPSNEAAIKQPERNTSDSSQTQVKIDKDDDQSAEGTKTVTTGDKSDQSATTLAQKIKSGNVNEQELVKQTYQKIGQTNGKLNNVVYVDPANAQQQIKQLAKEDKEGKPFYGVPLLIKGLGQAYKNYPNTEGLPYMKDNHYGFTGKFVKQLQKMGFIILGQTNFPELGLINITVSNLNGVAHNPWNLDHNTGGSSGGATASVAAGIVPIATGNDAGGSLRIPASWSGVIGLKPTQGLVIGDSLTPSVVNFAETRNIEDTVTLLNGLMDKEHAQKLLQPLPTDLKKVKIAYSVTSPVGTPVSQDARNAVLNAVAFLKDQGFEVVEQNGPVDGIKMMQAYFLGALDDGAVANQLAKRKLHRNLSAEDVTNGLVSPMTYALYEASKKAPQNVSQLFAAELKLVHQQMTAFHQQYPIYLTPTTATVAPLNSDPAYLPEYVARLLKIKDLPFNQQMQLIYDAWLHGLTKTPFTQLANLSGEPAISLPTYVSAAGLPLGIQLEGAKGTDFLLLELGKLFEDHHQFILLDQYLTKQTHANATKMTEKQQVLGNKSEQQSIICSKNGQKNIKGESSNLPQWQSQRGKNLPQTGDYSEALLFYLGITFLGLTCLASLLQLNKRR